MEIKHVRAEELKPAEYNPRQLTEEQYRQLRISIERFGLVDPIIVNSFAGRENIVIGGHMRLKIARELGYETVPVHYVSLEEAKEKELNLRLNRNTGQWDWSELANGFDTNFLLEVGFNPGELGMVPGQPAEEKDKDDLGHHMDTYLDGNVRQVVLYFQKEEFDQIVPRLDVVMKDFAVESHTEAFLRLLAFYENSKSKETGA